MERPIPDRLYFRIKEVCKITGLKPYVIRYWEQEFKEIKPVKSLGGQRLYSKKDIERLLLIKRLLYERGFTIEGAKKQLSKKEGLLKEIKKELKEILYILEGGVK